MGMEHTNFFHNRCISSRQRLWSIDDYPILIRWANGIFLSDILVHCISIYCFDVQQFVVNSSDCCRGIYLRLIPTGMVSSQDISV